MKLNLFVAFAALASLSSTLVLAVPVDSYTEDLTAREELRAREREINVFCRQVIVSVHCHI
jgi:hypothetical protein